MPQREKGDKHLLPERPEGGHHACTVVAQKVPDPFPAGTVAMKVITITREYGAGGGGETCSHEEIGMSRRFVAQTAAVILAVTAGAAQAEEKAGNKQRPPGRSAAWTGRTWI